VPGGGAGIGVTSGLQSYGGGASLPEAALQGAATGIGVAGGGALASKIPLKGIPGLLARTGAATAGMEIPQAALTGRVPTAKEVLPNLLLMGGLEAMHGVEPRGKQIQGRVDELPDDPYAKAVSEVQGEQNIPSGEVPPVEPVVKRQAKVVANVQPQESAGVVQEAAAQGKGEAAQPEVTQAVPEVGEPVKGEGKEPPIPQHNWQMIYEQWLKASPDMQSVKFRPGASAHDVHRSIVDEALRRNRPVPDAVRAEYPDLVAKYAAEPPPPTVEPQGTAANRNVGSDISDIVKSTRQTQAEFLRSKGTTIEEARSLSKPQQKQRQAEYTEWLKQRESQPPAETGAVSKPERVRMAGAEFDVVRRHPDGTATLRNAEGDTFETSANEKLTPVQRASAPKSFELPATKKEYIDQHLAEQRAARQAKLREATAAAESLVPDNTPRPVGISKLQWLETRPRPTLEQRKALTSVRVARQNLESDTRTDVQAWGTAYDRLKAKEVQPPVETKPVTAAQVTPSIEQAFTDWTDGRAYIDNNGNYRVKQPRTNGLSSGGRIAPWNKEVKRSFSDVQAFHEAATAAKQGAAETPQAKPGLTSAMAQGKYKIDIDRKTGRDRFNIKEQNPRTGQWELRTSSTSLDNAKEWLSRKGVDPTEASAKVDKITARNQKQADKIADIQAKQKAARRGEEGFLAIGDIAKAVHRVAQNTRDIITVDATPKLARAGVSVEARQHAAARGSVPHVVRDLLAKVFPDSYGKPEDMARTVDILNKDNILGGYDTFLKRAKEAKAAGKTEEAAQWQARADAVGDARDIAALEADVQAAKNDPEISANIERWKAIVNPELDTLYNKMKRLDPNTPRESRGREFGARINLLPESHAQEMATFHDLSKPMPQGSTSNFRNPNVKRDPFMRAAKFTGEYSTDPEAVLTNVLGPRLNETTKLDFYNALIDKGVAIETEPGEPAPLEIGGQKPTRLAIKVPQTGADGKTSIVEKSLWIRPDLVREARGVLDTDMPLPSNPVFKFLTQIQLAQLTDMTAHLKNVHTVLAGSVGTRSAFRDAVKRLPILGSVDSIARITDVTREIAQDTPAMRAEIAQMSKFGLIRPEYPSTGLQKITRGQQLIHSVDTAARVTMNRFFDNLAERGMVRDTPENRANFVQQIGEYNRRLMGPWMRGMRDYGLSPFVVAGRTFNRQGRRLLMGAPGVQASSAGSAAQMRTINLTSGLVAATVLPAILNYVTTGAFGGRPGTPLGAWDLGKPEEDGKHKVIDLMQILGIRRGLRATGLGAVIEGLREGQTKNEIAGHAIQDVITSASHPWMGPGLGFAYQTLTGRRLDLRGGPEPPAAENVGGGKQYLENARTALQTQNPLLYGLASPLIGTEAENTSETFLKRVGKGIIKAPSSAAGIQDLSSPAEKMMHELAQQRGASPPTAQQKMISSLAQARRNGEDIRAKFDEAKKAGILTDKDTEAIVKRIQDRHLVRGFRPLPFTDALRVFELATPDERAELKDALIKKFDVDKIPPKQRDKTVQRMRQALGIQVR
jgi:hypothetical protein